MANIVQPFITRIWNISYDEDENTHFLLGNKDQLLTPQRKKDSVVKQIIVSLKVSTKKKKLLKNINSYYHRAAL